MANLLTIRKYFYFVLPKNPDLPTPAGNPTCTNSWSDGLRPSNILEDFSRVLHEYLALYAIFVTVKASNLGPHENSGLFPGSLISSKGVLQKKEDNKS